MCFERAWIRVGAVVLIVGGMSGCKSGASFAKPSWWTLGGAGTADAEKLAAAPPYSEPPKTADGAIAMPSASATPYPTTTTPQGYVVTGATAPAASIAAQPPTVSDAPITYGKTPPPLPEARATPLSTQQAAAPSAPAAVATQSGPYATLPAAAPAAPPAAPVESPIGQSRFADARSAEGFGAPPVAQPSSSFATAPTSAPATPSFAPATAAGGLPAGPDSRYGMASGSRFGGDPASAPAAGLSAVPSAAPSAGPGPGYGTAPVAAPTGPAATPASLPSSPPTRRPDPGYRPGGTSSYRPSKTILVGEPAAAESAVRTAAFESPAEPIRQ